MDSNKVTSYHSGKAKQQLPAYNLCVDFGASYDLIPHRSHVMDYKDTTNACHYVVVADDTQIPVHDGIGTV